MSQTCQKATSAWAGILRICRITPSREVLSAAPAGHSIWPGRRYHRLDHGHARRPTRVLAWGQETDFYGSQLLIDKLPTTITATIITAATITAATITAATITDAAITAATITAAATARRRRRRNPDSTAAAAAAPTGVVPTATTPRAAATPSAATPATRANVRRTVEALCFDVGRNGGSSECEGRCEHGGYPA